MLAVSNVLNAPQCVKPATLAHVLAVAVATSYAYVNPLVALALGVGLAGEQIGSQALLALPLILGGVLILGLPALRGRGKLRRHSRA